MIEDGIYTITSKKEVTRLILRSCFQCGPDHFEWRTRTFDIENEALRFLIKEGFEVIGAEAVIL